jgi:membrane-associated phospholipid phosphatase
VRAGETFLSAEDRLKLAIISWIVVLDGWWIVTAHYTFDVFSLAKVLAVLSALLIFADVYRRLRAIPMFVVMTRETAWLLGFSAAAAVLSNLVITANMPLIDEQLAAVDRALGFDWMAWYTYVSSHRNLGLTLSLAYVAALPELAVVIVGVGLYGKVDRAAEMVMAAMIGALMAIAISAALPAAGALAYFRPDESNLASPPIVDLAYKATFFDLRAGLVRVFSLSDLKGLIAFPSYHSTLAVLTLLATRGMPRLFWPLAVFNLIVLASTPVDGGHHLADVIGGVAVALAAFGITVICRRKLHDAVQNPVRRIVAEPAPVRVSLSEKA